MGRPEVQARGRPTLAIFPHCAPGDTIQPAWLTNPKTCESNVHTVPADQSLMHVQRCFSSITRRPDLRWLQTRNNQVPVDRMWTAMYESNQRSNYYKQES